MIIGQDILRLLTCRVLRGQTFAGNRVFDSPAQPADLKIAEDRAPFIAVYTDDADADLQDQSFNLADTRVYLLIECACVAGAEKNPDMTDEQKKLAVELAHTDEALELAIGILSRQCIQAFQDHTPWAELWKKFTSTGRHRVEVRRGGPGQQSQQTAIRFASRIMRMQVNVLSDPVYGESTETTGFWKQFVALAEKDDELGFRPDPTSDDPNPQSVIELIRSQWETNPPAPQWRVDQRRGLWTNRALHSLGITPPRLRVSADGESLEEAEEETINGEP